MPRITLILFAATALLCPAYAFGPFARQVAAAPTNNCPAADQCSFLERFASITDRWLAADGYANGVPFDAWWSKKHAFIDVWNRVLKLGVDREPKHGKPFAAGQLQSNRWHGYGCYEVRMKPIDQSGLLSTFFTYTGQYDAAPGMSKTHNEIDIEFVWRQTEGKLLMQCNYYTKGKGGNEHFVNLPFNPALSFGNYAFRWTSKSIEWFVNGKSVYTAYTNIPQVADSPHKIMMNFWPVAASASGWAGTYNHQGQRNAEYKGVRFTKGENCQIRNNFTLV